MRKSSVYGLLALCSVGGVGGSGRGNDARDFHNLTNTHATLVSLTTDSASAFCLVPLISYQPSIFYFET